MNTIRTVRIIDQSKIIMIKPTSVREEKCGQSYKLNVATLKTIQGKNFT